MNTMTAYCLYMTTNVSDHRYDFGVKGHGQKYLKSVLRLKA